MKDWIRIRGARQHNLKDVNIDIPRAALTVITGPSGSGKSSLAFDTLYAEGQRRYVESLSAYARQFLERLQKPDVDYIEGISPAVALQQNNPVRSSRSTVGTATEIYDYLRLLWARVGRTFCPVCGRELKADTVESVTSALCNLESDTRFMIAAPLLLSEKANIENVVADLRARGYVRVVSGGKAIHIDELQTEGLKIDLGSLFVVVDRLSAQKENRARIAEAVEQAFREGNGDITVFFVNPVRAQLLVPEVHTHASITEARWSEHFRCPDDGYKAQRPTPQLFSFNNPQGACSKCNGFGANLDYDISLIVPDKSKSIRDGAIDPWTKPRYEKQRRTLVDTARALGVDPDAPWSSISKDDQHFLLHGKRKGYIGIFPFLVNLEEKKYKQYIRVFLRQYQKAITCDSCKGSRLKAEALSVWISSKRISDITALSVKELLEWLESISLTQTEREIAAGVLHELISRTSFLNQAGLGYLSMDRNMRTLSGGEAQRISLANALGSALVDATYVLDEPSVGLHPRDMNRLMALLLRLRDLGNTVVVVEHDLDAMKLADYMIELGPAAGEKGGELVYGGPLPIQNSSSLTSSYLTGERSITLPPFRRATGPKWLEIKGANIHTLKNVDVKIPVGGLTVVSGVSGSGKSSLVHDVLFRALENHFTGSHSAKEHLGEEVGTAKSISGADNFADVVMVDQSPIGKTPRSNPVTYVKAWDHIRKLFADSPQAREKGLSAGDFSFNIPGGRCDACDGAGSVRVEMVFMADVEVVCETCGGRRFKPDILSVKVKGMSIYDVLQLTIDQAIRAFPREDKFAQALWHIQQVGLGYLRLGQAATTLSGGESQRLRIARELAQSKGTARGSLYIMDEPTTGLHPEDIKRLVTVFDRLIDQGHTVLLVEHNLDVIKLADWVIDMGPEGGSAGGNVVVMGTPETVMACAASHTGEWLRKVIPEGGVPVGERESRLKSGVRKRPA